MWRRVAFSHCFVLSDYQVRFSQRGTIDKLSGSANVCRSDPFVGGPG
jgi:hypothetical protein